MDLQKRKKNYAACHWNSQKRRKQFVLEPGMKGFLCTCNFREKDCVRDAYKILNEFSENQVDETQISNSEEKDIPESDEDSEDQDISAALNKEINDLKAESHKPILSRKFQVVATGVKNVIFISSTVHDPVGLVTKILKELEETKKQRTRFLLRLIPIEAICKAYLNDIKQTADALFERYFSQVPKTFSIIFSRHSNNNVQRNEVIEDLAQIIMKKNPGNKADLKKPELAAIVEVIRGVCLLSVVPDYYRYKKYNLLEICSVKDKIAAEITDMESKIDVKEVPSATTENKELRVEPNSAESTSDEQDRTNEAVE